MKFPILCGIALISAATASAQTTPAATSPAQTPTTPNAPANVTMVGCIGGDGSASSPITMTNPTIVPTAAQPGSMYPPTAGAGATPPAGSPPPPTAAGVPPPTTQPGVPPTVQPVLPPSEPFVPPTGTTGAAGASGTSPTGTAGAAGSNPAGGSVAPGSPTAGTSRAGGTTGAATGAGLSGYRLTGTDVSSWVGRRVQIVGSVVPAASGSAVGSPSATAGSNPMPEFRVTSVQPMTGSCPQR